MRHHILTKLFTVFYFIFTSSIFSQSFDKLTAIKFAGHQGGFISPHGHFIAYGSFESGIAIYNIQTNESYYATTNPFDYLPYWSSDENYIAYTSDVDGIFIKHLPDSEPENVTNGLYDFVLKWSKDNALIYFTFVGDTAILSEITIDDKSKRILSKFYPDDMLKTSVITLTPVSPGNEYFAYASKRAGVENIWIRDLNTGRDKQLTFSDVPAYSPAWSPNGEVIAYFLDQGDIENIYLLPLDNSADSQEEPFMLTDTETHKYSLSWTSNNELCFAQQVGDSTEFWLISDIETGVRSSLNTIPKNLELVRNYPNPFNPVTNIEFYISKPSKVSISIYDINGCFKRTLYNNYTPSGYHLITWDAAYFSTGIYIIKIGSTDFSKSIKCMLLK